MCPGRGEDSYHSIQVETRFLLNGLGESLPRNLVVVYIFSSLFNLYLPVSHTKHGYCACFALIVIWALVGLDQHTQIQKPYFGKAEVIL